MPLPMVAIVGRPNVGKSSLLNVLAGKRISIVDPTAGVTRDRIQTLCEHDDTYFDLVDTGGYGIVDRDHLNEQVEQQIGYAVHDADLILFIVDAREGVLPLDVSVAEWLRSCDRRVLLIANKSDSPDMPLETGEFNRLGFGEPLEVSAIHRRGIRELKGYIVENVSQSGSKDVPGEPIMRLAIVGKRNVGKSTFINSLAGAERVIVSETAGTTRDAVDVRFERDGLVYTAIDTAGVRKKSKIADDIEFYSFHRAQLSVRRSDVTLLLIDSTMEVSAVDKRLARYISDQFKPCIVVVNKWDLAKGRATTEDYGDYLLKTLVGLSYAPVAFVTATMGKNIQSVIDLSAVLFKQAQTRVSTADINTVVSAATEENAPRAKRGTGQPKIYYATQAGTCPPTIVFFVNHLSRISPTYERFLSGRLRDALPFSEVPIRLVFRSHRLIKDKSENVP